MKISTNIIANCSDFVWSLNTPDIDIIKATLKKIDDLTNWTTYTKIWFGDGEMFIKVDIDEIEVISYNEDNENHHVIGVDLVGVLKRFNPAISKDNYKESEFYEKYKKYFSHMLFYGETTYVGIVIAHINHLPNEDGIYVMSSFNVSDLPVRYTDGYCDEKFVINEDQPQGAQLKIFGEILRNIGGKFHHEDGGYAQADWHAKWFKENGYEDILRLGDGDPDSCDEE